MMATTMMTRHHRVTHGSRAQRTTIKASCVLDTKERRDSGHGGWGFWMLSSSTMQVHLVLLARVESVLEHHQVMLVWRGIMLM